MDEPTPPQPRRDLVWVLVFAAVLLAGATARWLQARRVGRGIDVVAASAAEPLRLDLNTASAAELQLLPGVGADRAAGITSWRKDRGPFRNVDDLARVPGMTPAVVDGLRPFVVCRAPGTAPP